MVNNFSIILKTNLTELLPAIKKSGEVICQGIIDGQEYEMKDFALDYTSMAIVSCLVGIGKRFFVLLLIFEFRIQTHLISP